MGIFDNPFGGLFDFNRDGHTDMFEAGLGFSIMQEVLGEAEREDRTNVISSDSDLDDLEEEELHEELDKLNNKLRELDLNEPEDYFSKAHERWEERRDALTEQIQEIEDQLLYL